MRWGRELGLLVKQLRELDRYFAAGTHNPVFHAYDSGGKLEIVVFQQTHIRTQGGGDRHQQICRMSQVSLGNEACTARTDVDCVR